MGISCVLWSEITLNTDDTFNDTDLDDNETLAQLDITQYYHLMSRHIFKVIAIATFTKKPHLLC